MNEHQSADHLRMGVAEFKSRLESGESIAVLDARNRDPWESSPVKVKGAIRWTGHVDPA